MTPTSCPFCNAVLPALTASPAADKLPCPRCGELIPTSRWQVDTSIAAGEPKRAAHEVSGPSSSLPGNRQTAFFILGIMLTMAIVGLSYMLWTVKLRQSRHPKSALDPVVFTQPLDLNGLGYLPKDCDIIVGLHIAEWLDDKKVGQPLLEEPRPAPIDWVANQLPRMTGLKLEEIDHAVLALSFGAQVPQVYLVVKTRRAYDLGKIGEHAQAANPPLLQDRALYTMPVSFGREMPAIRGEALLWCVEDKTILGVIGILDAPKREHLNGFSMKPRHVDEVLFPALQQMTKERLPKRDFLWAVGKFDRLGAIRNILAFMKDAKTNRDSLKDLQAFAVGLEPVEGLTLTGNFRLTDAKSAAQFKTMLEGVKIEGAKSQKVEATPIEEPQQWVTWQVRGDAAAMRAWLKLGQK